MLNKPKTPWSRIFVVIFLGFVVREGLALNPSYLLIFQFHHQSSFWKYFARVFFTAGLFYRVCCCWVSHITSVECWLLPSSSSSETLFWMSSSSSRNILNDRWFASSYLKHIIFKHKCFFFERAGKSNRKLVKRYDQLE